MPGGPAIVDAPRGLKPHGLTEYPRERLGGMEIGGAAMNQEPFVSLRDVAEQPRDTIAPKNAPLAWALSLFLPGTGQIYCGARTRGLVLLAFLGLALASLLSRFHPGQVVTHAAAIVFVGGWSSEALRALPILWAFASFDAYATALERNEGLDPSLVDNPRVAGTLNLLTKGFGYFYLGERTKGFALFAGLNLAGLLVVATVRSVPALVLARWILEFVVIGVAVDAYRKGNQSLNDTRVSLGLTPDATPVRFLPRPIPLAVATLLLFLWVGLLAYASAVVLSQPDGLINFLVREARGTL